MMRMFYAGGSILTSDDIAAAIVAYAQTLARAGTSDVVSVPIVQEEDLKQGTASMLIGPGSQLLCVPVVHDGVTGPIDNGLVGELERRRQALASSSSRHRTMSRNG
jgi:hypothetical protein